MPYDDKRLTIALLIGLGLAVPAAAQLPSVPGFEVDVYASVPAPVRISFNPASGLLYAGRQLADPRAATRIHRIGPGGSSVEPYGTTAISDPDVPLFDPSGSISGGAGSVLVGRLNAGPPDRGLISAIAPSGEVSTIFGPSTSYLNPTDMTFDSAGRLLFVDAGIDASQPLSVFVSTGLEPVALITFPVGQRPVAIAIDANDRIYTSAIGRSDVQVHDSTGTLLDSSFATNLPEALLAFGAGGAFGTDLYAIACGELVRVAPTGAQTVVGNGFEDATGLAFGPDGSLYVTELTQDRILRIAGISSAPGAIPSNALRLSKAQNSEIVVEWFPTCSASATDYALYEGAVGLWYSHAPVVCFDAGKDYREQFVPSAGDAYYLVVPLDGQLEGSYGVDAHGQERPPGDLPCGATQAIACP